LVVDKTRSLLATFPQRIRFSQQVGAYVVRYDVVAGDVTARDLPATNPVAAGDRTLKRHVRNSLFTFIIVCFCFCFFFFLGGGGSSYSLTELKLLVGSHEGQMKILLQRFPYILIHKTK